MVNENQDDELRTPPYISFQTLKTLMEKLKKDGLPHQIDRSILTNFSGSVANQILPALKFLGLTNDDGTPTASFSSLLNAYGTDEWATTLSVIINKSYAPLINSLPLDKATAAQFNSKFKEVFQAKDTVVRKCIPFFLNAAKDANMNISAYITNGTRARTAPSKPRQQVRAKSKARIAPSKAPHREEPREDVGTSHKQKAPSEVLLSLYVDDMEDGQKSAIWNLIQYYKSNGDEWPNVN